MNHHAWASKQLIVPITIALALAPALKAAESSRRASFDGKTRTAERAAALPELAHEGSGVPQQADRQLPPQPAEQQLVAPPRVTYEDGQLTIVAENSSLSDVMKALRAALGADIDLPAGAADQHIWVHLGPGSPRRVVRDLLDGTEFNYVIQASQTDADGILSVLLTPRSKSTGAERAGAPERSAVRRMPGHGSDTQSGTESENPPAAEGGATAQAVPSEPGGSGDPSQTTPAAPPATPATPVLPANASSASLQNTPGDLASARPAAPTDPNQQIQTLQSMYQQRRQLQMQQNQSQKPAGPN